MEEKEEWVIVSALAVPPSRAADVQYVLEWGRANCHVVPLPDGSAAIRRWLLRKLVEELGVAVVKAPVKPRRLPLPERC